MIKLTRHRLRDGVEVTHESRRPVFVTVPTAIVGVERRTFVAVDASAADESVSVR